jgi:hypothetical protein
VAPSIFGANREQFSTCAWDKKTNDDISPDRVFLILRGIAIYEMHKMLKSLTSEVFDFTSIHRIVRFYPDDQKLVRQNLATYGSSGQKQLSVNPPILTGYPRKY